MSQKKKQKQGKGSAALMHLTTEEVSRLLRPRASFDAYALKLIQGYETYIDQLRIPGLDPTAVLAALAAYQALAADEDAAAQHLAMIKETRLAHASTVWSAMLEIYARGQSAARTDANAQTLIEDFAQFMKKRSKKKKAATPTPPTPPTA